MPRMQNAILCLGECAHGQLNRARAAAVLEWASCMTLAAGPSRVRLGAVAARAP